MSSLLVAIPDLASWGGVARSSRRLVSSLRQAGHSVCLCGPEDALFPGERKTEPELWRFSATPRLDFAFWTQEITLAAQACRAQVVIGYYGTSAGFCAVAAAAELGLPSILSLRGNDVDRDFFLPDRQPRLAFAVRLATEIITVSQALAKRVQAWFGRNATTVTNAVDTTLFYPDSEGAQRLRCAWGLDSRPVLGLFGEFKAKRGLGLLRELESALQAWQLLLVGRLRPEVQGLVPPAACCQEPLDNDATLRAAYSLCDVVLQPSLADGMPNVVLEAMACGCTVVASPVGGLKDLIVHERNGLLCSSPEQWREALESLVQCPRPDLGLEARRSVPKLDVELAQFREVLRRVLPEGSGDPSIDL